MPHIGANPRSRPPRRNPAQAGHRPASRPAERPTVPEWARLPSTCGDNDMKAMLAAGLSFLLLLGGSDAVLAQDKKARDQSEINATADEVLKEFLEMNGARALFDKAAGYAVFKVTKAGLGASGAGGNGVAIDKATGNRTYMRMGSAGVGFTFGVSRYDIVILFESAEKL